MLLADIALVTTGVSISAYGEANLVVKGLVLLLISLVFEAVRLTLTQQMIQSSGLRSEALGGSEGGPLPGESCQGLISGRPYHRL